jgi:hypothetical protein
LAGAKNRKDLGAFGRKKEKMKIIVAWNKKILITVIADSVQSVYSFLVSVILNSTTVCFGQADIYRIAKDVEIMIVCHIFERSMVVDLVQRGADKS